LESDKVIQLPLQILVANDEEMPGLLIEPVRRRHGHLKEGVNLPLGDFFVGVLANGSALAYRIKDFLAHLNPLHAHFPGQRHQRTYVETSL
jgi:hypothetical protein